ncbi:AAA family ATPase [bacterium]|nr:AAA family ATPase [bacterium]
MTPEALATPPLIPDDAAQRPPTIRGRVVRLFFETPEFCAGRFETEQKETISFSAKFHVGPGEHLVLTGAWKTHPKYGMQFEAETAIRNLSLSGEGLASYLANNPDFKFIGPVRARKIAEACGEDFERTIVERPEHIAQIAGIRLADALKIQEVWEARRAFNNASTQLSAFGLTHRQVETLLAKYGSDAVSIVKNNPFILVRELDGYGFKRVDEIARRSGFPKDHTSRVRAGVVWCVMDALDAGHTWIELRELIDAANKLLILDRPDAKDIIEAEIDELVRIGALVMHPGAGRFLVALPSVREAELAVGRFLSAGREIEDGIERRGLLADNPHALSMLGAEKRILDREVGAELNDGQRQAVLAVLRNRVSAIVGAAGSGKTFTVRTIVELFESYDLSVTLCAPTGKAARRMTESTGREASTIHRLLGYDGKGFAHGADNKLDDFDILVIDEMSMVDVMLAHALFSALDIEKVAVILVGDHNQLPPVGPGNVLRDIIRRNLCPVTTLSQVVRQAGELKRNSTAILQGYVARTSETPDESGVKPWYVVNNLQAADAIENFLFEFYRSILADRLGFDLVREVQLLTPRRGGALSVTELNLALQRIVQHKVFGRDVPATKGKRPAFLAGDKVIQRKNDYDLGVMNGTIGYVVTVEGNGDLIVNFDGAGEVTISKSAGDVSNIDLAYALTIHQTQGSEFPCVVVVTHKSHSFMHHRNLLYTAVTRSRKTCVIVGDRWGIENCVKKVGNDERNTWLSVWESE